jgi:hypothetical protein
MANDPGEAPGPLGVMHVGTLVARIKDPEFSLPQSARTGTNRIVGRCAASQIASASTVSFFCRLTNGLT